eukprot:gnl/MRDRNA2_/MRDRNA2_36531_c0_seq1.p1 gnl/MRDRNA2_/MRDRNA2_36531_c0~~gnl/MRDRNA2_/MRDRNA2_36531_c0_seq1.p1  ORF type:complete len:256 (+),score=42.04 gnl/MRDRNA2_/MRDRNA2_36531_c0_seq1:213-980(+)
MGQQCHSLRVDAQEDMLDCCARGNCDTAGAPPDATWHGRNDSRYSLNEAAGYIFSNDGEEVLQPEGAMWAIGGEEAMGRNREAAAMMGRVKHAQYYDVRQHEEPRSYKTLQPQDWTILLEREILGAGCVSSYVAEAATGALIAVAPSGCGRLLRSESKGPRFEANSLMDVLCGQGPLWLGDVAFNLVRFDAELTSGTREYAFALARRRRKAPKSNLEADFVAVISDGSITILAMYDELSCDGCSAVLNLADSLQA